MVGQNLAFNFLGRSDTLLAYSALVWFVAAEEMARQRRTIMTVTR